MASSHVLSPGLAVDAAEAKVSLVRLYTLRLCYLILAVGLGVTMWPAVIHHTGEYAIRAGIQMSLLAGLGAAALLGLRYPVQMLPLLLFELIWKTIYLVAFALPLWSAHQINDKAAGDIQACLSGGDLYSTHSLALCVPAVCCEGGRALAVESVNPLIAKAR